MTVLLSLFWPNLIVIVGERFLSLLQYSYPLGPLICTRDEEDKTRMCQHETYNYYYK